LRADGILLLACFDPDVADFAGGVVGIDVLLVVSGSIGIPARPTSHASLFVVAPEPAPSRERHAMCDLARFVPAPPFTARKARCYGNAFPQ